MVLLSNVGMVCMRIKDIKLSTIFIYPRTTRLTQISKCFADSAHQMYMYTGSCKILHGVDLNIVFMFICIYMRGLHDYKNLKMPFMYYLACHDFALCSTCSGDTSILCVYCTHLCCRKVLGIPAHAVRVCSCNKSDCITWHLKYCAVIVLEAQMALKASYSLNMCIVIMIKQYSKQACLYYTNCIFYKTPNRNSYCMSVVSQT